MPEGTSGSGDVDPMVEMHAVIDELQFHNQTLKDGVYNIKQYQ